jgi:hypothetical protein
MDAPTVAAGRGSVRALACALVAGPLLFAVAPTSATARDGRAPGIVVGPGQTMGRVLAFGVPVRIEGTVQDDVIVIGGRVTITGTARLRDEVYLLGATTDIDPDAQLDGGLIVLSPAVLRPWTSIGGTGETMILALAVVRLVALLLVAALAWALAPTAFTARQTRRLAEHPLRVVALGAVWALLLGTSVVVATLSLLGLPLAMLLSVLLGAESVIGLAIGAAAPSRTASLRARRPILIATALLLLVPVIGEMLLYAAAAVGLGVTLAALAEAHGLRLMALDGS